MRDKVHWVIQVGIGPREDINKYAQSCKILEIPFTKITFPPFTTSLSSELINMIAQGATNAEAIIFVGGVSLTTAAFNSIWKYWVWADPAQFNYLKYLDNYGSLMLNFESAVVTTIDAFSRRALLTPNEEVFIRPVNDDKAFPGTIIRCKDFTRWASSITGRGYSIDETCPIIVATPIGISKEWRTFIVDKKVVASSSYTSSNHSIWRQAFEPEVTPSGVIELAEAAARIWSPAPVFCMDICKSGPHYYIVECGTFHCCGLYDAPIIPLVDKVTSYVEEQLCRGNA